MIGAVVLVVTLLAATWALLRGAHKIDERDRRDLVEHLVAVGLLSRNEADSMRNGVIAPTPALSIESAAELLAMPPGELRARGVVRLRDDREVVPLAEMSRLGFQAS